MPAIRTYVATGFRVSGEGMSPAPMRCGFVIIRYGSPKDARRVPQKRCAFEDGSTCAGGAINWRRSSLHRRARSIVCGQHETICTQLISI